MGILELVYDTCEKMDEKKLKALKRGNYKFKGQRIKRPVFEAGQTIVGVEVKEGEPENIKELSRIEEIGE